MFDASMLASSLRGSRNVSDSFDRTVDTAFQFGFFMYLVGMNVLSHA